MIEQTDMIVTNWDYQPYENTLDTAGMISHTLTLEVMRKRAADKKGLACRFTSCFSRGDIVVLNYTGEDSYVIDLGDKIDMQELHTMISNSYSKFKEKFEIRKFGTILQKTDLGTLDESSIDFAAILPLLDD